MILKALSITRWRSALWLLLVLVLVIPVRHVQADEEGIQIHSVDQQDIDNDGQPDLTLIDCSFATAHDLIYVVDYGRDMQSSKDWREATDFNNDIWLYDIGADGTIQLIVVYKRESERNTAYIYDDRNGDGMVEYERVDKEVTILESDYWTARILSDSNWYLPDGRLNLNVVIQLDGPIPTLDRAPDFFIQDWLLHDGWIDIEFEEVAGPDGIAQYALKRLDTDSPWDGGFERSGLYSNNGHYPTGLPKQAFFPFLPIPVVQQGTEYRNLRYFDLPPRLTMDWQAGRIMAVGLDGYPTGHGYHFNNNRYIIKGQVNEVSFESPQAYYDLAQNHDAFAEMHIRFFTRPANDQTMWYLPGKDSHPWQSIRMDWNLFNPGTLRWDFKLGVGGNHTVDSIVQFRDFALRTVPFQKLPYWITEREWKLTTFVAREGEGYDSSEGIYEWQADTGDDPQLNPERAFQARDATHGYMLGTLDESPDSFFQSTHPGFRAERHLTGPMKPGLYFSPIDRKLHLLGAEAGVWTIDDEQVIRYANLDGDLYLDQWSYFNKDQLQREVNWADSYLIYAGENQVWLKKTDIEPSLFETLPPRNHEEWLAQRQNLEANQQDFVPGDLKEMLEQFSGSDWRIENATMHSFRQEGSGFRFVLDLQPGFRAAGSGGPDLRDLIPGTYLVHYEETLTVLPFTPAAPSISLLTGSLRQLQLNSITVQVTNGGLEDMPEATIELWSTSPEGDQSVIAEKSIDLLAQKTFTEVLFWAPRSSGSSVLTPKIRQPDGRIVSGEPVTIQIASSARASIMDLLLISSSPETIPVIPFGLLGFASIIAFVFWRGWEKFTAKNANVANRHLQPIATPVQDIRCPNGHADTIQRRAGFNRSGSQRLRCGLCRRVYTPYPNFRGYPVETRMLAVRMHLEGNSYNVIGNVLKVSPKSVVRWVKQYQIDFARDPASRQRLEQLDELYRIDHEIKFTPGGRYLSKEE